MGLEAVRVYYCIYFGGGCLWGIGLNAVTHFGLRYLRDQWGVGAHERFPSGRG
jgi:hypothetical protein